MPFCSKCGIRLNDDDLFCPKCGRKVVIYEDNSISEKTKTEAETVSSEDPAENTFDYSGLSYSESVILADKLYKQYRLLEQTQDKISELETSINRPSDTPVRAHSAFRYFWPSLIIAAVGFVVTYVIGTIFVIISHPSDYEVAVGIAAVIAVAVAAAILIIGGVRARKKRDNEQSSLNEDEISRNKRKDQMRAEASTHRTKATSIRKSLKSYETGIPKEMRNSKSMNKVKNFLQTHKAETIADAFEMLKR